MIQRHLKSVECALKSVFMNKKINKTVSKKLEFFGEKVVTQREKPHNT